MIKNWDDANRYLGGKLVAVWRGLQNTYLRRTDAEWQSPIELMYCNKPIVTYYYGNSVKLSGNGYRRATKARLNLFTPHLVRERNNGWIITIGIPDGTSITMPFRDNIIIHNDGTIEGGI